MCWEVGARDRTQGLMDAKNTPVSYTNTQHILLILFLSLPFQMMSYFIVQVDLGLTT